MHDETRNKTWNDNHTLIETAFWKIYAETEKIPKISAIVQETGLSPKTIYEHYQDMDTSRITEKYKVHLDRAMSALAVKAEGGDVMAVQLLAKLCGWVEKKKTELDIKQKTVEVKFSE